MKNLTNKITVIIAATIMLFSSCYKDEKNLNEKLQGTWKAVGGDRYIFSANKGRRGHLFINSAKDPNFDFEADYKIKGYKLIFNDRIYTIKEITDHTLYWDSPHTYLSR